MENKKFLYDTIDTILENIETNVEIPNFIINSLNKNVVLRKYQEEVLKNTIYYLENKNLSKNRQTHLLYHMATGSGKTVIMASMILYYYNLGYRNFVFFVNTKNIIEKTKYNFINTKSSKYLFNKKIIIDGKEIKIKAVDNFNGINNDDINILFTTIQKLHTDIFEPKENGISINDFEENKCVLLADEAHHVNTNTKKKTKEEEIVIKSWEYSVERIYSANKENVLLEFTATCDIKDKNILQKYREKIIFDYPLIKFRKSGYTKEFLSVTTDSSFFDRTIIALIISEYRRSLFEEIGQYAKPVVLLKSQNIDDSEKFYEEFNIKLQKLDGEKILFISSKYKNITNNDENITTLEYAIDYFKKKDTTVENLANMLKVSFNENNTIIINGKSDDNDTKRIHLNSLEDKENPYRLIFTVDMLNEGWDVLNLFDIVRLYDTRQGGGKVSPATIREAQLIGRGARYYPFNEEEKDRDKRKFDDDIDNKYRILETFIYHSKDDSKYIAELKEALRETGFLDENTTKFEYIVKEEFKQTKLYKEGYVFINKREKKIRDNIISMEARIKSTEITYKCLKNIKQNYLLNEIDNSRNYNIDEKIKIKRLRLNEIDKNILYYVMEKIDILNFETLKSKYPRLKSSYEFLNSENYIGNIVINFEYIDKITNEDKLNACFKIFNIIKQHIIKIKDEYYGTKDFYQKEIKKEIRDKTIKVSYIGEDGTHGTSQVNSNNEKYKLNLENKERYIYNDNYGTSEEKLLVKYIDNMMEELKQKYEEVFLIRNERLAELSIYNFEDGERFEPDFILFLIKNKSQGYIQEQIFIEPKGEHLIEKDKWKNEFLKKLQEEASVVKIYEEDNDYKIIGIPFYNSNIKEEFEEEFNKLLNS